MNLLSFAHALRYLVHAPTQGNKGYHTDYCRHHIRFILLCQASETAKNVSVSQSSEPPHSIGPRAALRYVRHAVIGESTIPSASVARAIVGDNGLDLAFVSVQGNNVEFAVVFDHRCSADLFDNVHFVTPSRPESVLISQSLYVLSTITNGESRTKSGKSYFLNNVQTLPGAIVQMSFRCTMLRCRLSHVTANTR